MADVTNYFVPFDLDSGAGSELVVGVNLRLSASGGSIEALGSQLSASSIPVVIASDQGAVSVDSELPAAAALSVDNVASPTAPAVGSFGHYFDGTNWDRIRGDSTDGMLVNLGANNDVTVTGAVDTELPAAAAMSDILANPTAPAVASHLVGFDRVNTDWTRIDGVVDGQAVNAAGAGFLQLGSDGTNYQVVTTDAAGHLQVDVLTGGGVDTPTNPFNDTQTSVAVAAGATVDIDGADDDNRNLAWVDVWSSVAWKGEVFTVDNGVESGRKGVTGGPAMTGVQYIPTHRTYIAVGATAGVDSFRLKFTNLDDNQAADAHVVFHYED